MNLNRRELLSCAMAAATLALLPVPSALAALSRASVIPRGYVSVGHEQDVPPAVLFAVAMQESRRLFGPSRAQRALPWPWTLNVRGTPLRFSSRNEAVSSLRDFLKDDVSLIDVGLMQVCWHYFSGRLLSPTQGLDPYWNLRVGASILRTHFLETKDWFTAIGRYHAPADKERANRYARNVSRTLAELLHA